MVVVDVTPLHLSSLAVADCLDFPAGEGESVPKHTLKDRGVDLLNIRIRKKCWQQF